MGVTVIPAPGAGSDNWELISSVSASGSSIAFTSIAGYKKLALRATVTLGSQDVSMRLNADTGSNYNYFRNNQIGTATSISAYAQTSFLLGSPSSAGSTANLFIQIDNADNSGLKNVSGVFFSSTGTAPVGDYVGQYIASASISTVTLIGSVGFNSGTVALYGVKA